MADLDESKFYEQVMAMIRATDDISLKLIGLVPLVSGAGLFSVLFTSNKLEPPIVVLISLFAASLTFGLFRWELRNIQRCIRLTKLSEDLEKQVVENLQISVEHAHDQRMPDKIDKERAEKIIYAVVIFAWLCMPHVTGLGMGASIRVIYSIGAAIITIATVMSLWVKLEPKKDDARRYPMSIFQCEE